MERFLAGAIKSVLGSSFADFELIIFDDGSTDQSAAICAAAAECDPRVHFTPHAHLGRNAALRAACALATGELIGLVDADDILGPEAIAATVSFLTLHPSTGLVYTNYETIDARGFNHGLGSRCRVPYSTDAELRSFLPHHFRLCRRADFEALGGFSADYPAAMDFEMCLRFSERFEIMHLCEVHYYYRLHEERMSVRQRELQKQCGRRAIHEALERRGLAVAL
jgi:glycosyltransferase involved in cell wall biosynthesis